MNRTTAGKPDEIEPEARHWQLLPGAGFADSYRAALPPHLATLAAGEIAARMMAGSPAWVTALLDLRNRLVAPLGLKGARLMVGATQADGGRPGFPVLADGDGQAIMGIDDSHLDFRLCVEKSPAGADGAQWLTVTTVVRTKRLLGRLYLAAIMPFHRRIVRTLLERLPG
ncbi:DUF2867 domain-containing protein [Herbaspirillum robiniae]|uniref:DUF2867 domain-containing protein n=1 Tax=Herbaspirillum robiniae TaxID=2014887 RepID=A0ABX2LQF9_9BURK|nr:DUF2867 domain-containing protein [Herbaspirillum robiniae]NUU00817.1 DUF2867 domain-containing protein [Herbaspirillum robiniae]